MEHDMTKLAIVVLSVMVFSILMTFYGQFNELLGIDEEMQEKRDEGMYKNLEKCIPGMVIVALDEGWIVKPV
ncbi:MAG: hypothetical protein U9Q22_03885 [Candidatus Altiarchaeota archaeon]|nr:hypothetical protein [Candidatus Altiarchaeota archaeon]